MSRRSLSQNSLAQRTFARNVLSRALIVLPLIFFLQGCIGGRSEPVQYQLLTARAEHNTAAPLAGKTIGIGPVHIAQFMQRPQIVTHAGGTQMHVEDTVRWGEPLEQGIQRVLLQNMSALTGAETRNFPWRQNMAPDYAVRIDVNDLDKLSNGEFVMEINWAIEDLKNARVLTTEQERIASNASYDDLLVQLSQHIAQVLTTHR